MDVNSNDSRKERMAEKDEVLTPSDGTSGPWVWDHRNRIASDSGPEWDGMVDVKLGAKRGGNRKTGKMRWGKQLK